jgi:hypothetical protein
MDVIQTQVVSLRGLPPKAPVQRFLLNTDQLRETVLDDFLKDYTPQDALRDEQRLTLLGLLSPGFDLRQLYIDLYTEQVTGYYNEKTKRMYVVQGEGFNGPERLTYSHEYDHVLQDQTYDLEHGLNFNHDACQSESERCAAIQALVEGDATLLEEQWLRTYATEQDRQQIAAFYQSYKSPVLDSAPQFLQEDFLFPYSAGYDFVHALYLKGGWAAVDAAYASPPLSTEQILHPERYPRDKPVTVPVPDIGQSLGPDWKEVDRDVLGEWTTRLMLEAHLAQDRAAQAAAGWGGDYTITLYNDKTSQAAFVLLTTWDSATAASRFAAAFTDYGANRWGKTTRTTTGATWSDADAFALLDTAYGQTLWILAPDAATAKALRQAIPFPARTS